MLHNSKPLIFLVMFSCWKGKVLQSQSVQRTYLQIVAEILDACTEPQSVTQILGKTGVSLRKLGFCLRELMKQDMISFHHRKRTYTTTRKGLRYLQVWKEPANA